MDLKGVQRSGVQARTSLDSDILKRVLSVLADIAQVPPESISLEKDIEEALHFDSLDFVALIQGLEAEFDIHLSRSDALSYVTPRDVIALTTSKLSAGT
jgi:acyl carrier protein